MNIVYIVVDEIWLSSGPAPWACSAQPDKRPDPAHARMEPIRTGSKVMAHRPGPARTNYNKLGCLCYLAGPKNKSESQRALLVKAQRLSLFRRCCVKDADK